MHSTWHFVVFSGLAMNLNQVSASPVERDYYAYTDCAYQGYSLNDSFASADVGTYYGCSTACFQYDQCKSFAFNNETGDCQIYNLSVDENLDLEYSSSYYFFDTACETTPECGLPGDDYRWRPFDYSNKVTEQSCKNKCSGLSNCKSYAYGNQECFLYDVPVKGNLNGRNNSPYLFYDRRCIANTTSTTSTTIAKSSSTTTKASSTSVSNTKASTTSSTSTRTILSTPNTTSKTSATLTTNQGSSSKTSASTTTAKLSTTTKSSGSSSTSSKQSSTTARVLSTSVTISSQVYFCTAAM